MYQVNLAEAITRLRDLINAAVSGETVFIKNDHQVVQLVPVLPSERRPQFGSAKGLIVMADDFDAPLADLAVEPRTRICAPRDCSQRQSNI